MTPPSEHKTLYLVDGTSQLFRAYFAIHGLTNDAGLPTNAVFGFTTMLRKLLQEEPVGSLAVAFDVAGKVFRHEAFPDYKANRPKAPEELRQQIPYAKQVCEVLGATVLERTGFEADDLIATYARIARERGVEVVVVASDKDLLQLVGDGVRVLNPSKNVVLDPDGVRESFGVPPERVLDAQGLMGDSVDNIPGVPGVGEKTAIEIVSRYGDLESVIDRAARFGAVVDARDAALERIDEFVAGEESDPADLAGAVAALSERLAELLQDEPPSDYRDRLAEAAEALGGGVNRALRDADRRAAVKQARAVKRALKALDKGSSRKVWLAIRDHTDQARLSRELATLNDRVPTETSLERLALGETDRAGAHALFLSLGFRTLLADYDSDGPSGDVESSGAGPAKQGRYETVLELEALERWVAACRRAGRFALDTETDGIDPMRAKLVGISLSAEEGAGAYLPVGHAYLGVPDQLSLDRVRESLGPLLADADVRKVGQNLKYDAHVLRRHGLPVAGWSMDTMVAAFLLNPGRPSFGMDALSQEYLGHTPIDYASVAGSGASRVTLDQVEVERVTEYAAEDADVTLRLAARLEPKLEQAGLDALYRRIDGPLLPILVEMEARGIRVDADLLAGMSSEMERAIGTRREEIHRLAGGAFNVDSPKQLRELLYERLGLQPRRKTAKSKVASTDAQALAELDHPIAAKVLEYRELAKLKSTYVDALPKLIHPETGRVHTSYHPTGAATGRLSSSDPNLQNIPARTEAGRAIRSAFVPREGWIFLASDYSQVELRVLAHLAGDEQLIAAFRAGEDIHRYTASRVFGVAQDLVSDPMRGRAKAVNFGILYGMSATRLAREQGMKRTEANRFIESYFERFASVRRYIDEVKESAQHDAAVRTLFGRVRYFPQLHGRGHRGIREAALRAAVNTTIQGTAADLMKLAMLRVDEELRSAGLEARMLLQVHDELLLEVPAGELEPRSNAGARRHGAGPRAPGAPARGPEIRRQLARGDLIGAAGPIRPSQH